MKHLKYGRPLAKAHYRLELHLQFERVMEREKIFSGRMRKVSAEGNPVLLGMANNSSRTECMRNQGCRIYRITGKFSELGVQSFRTYLTLSGAGWRCQRR